MSVGSLEPKFSQAFFETIGRPDLMSAELLAPKNVAEVKKQVRKIFKTKTRDEWVTKFSIVDACVEPVLTVKEALEDEQIQYREMVVDIDLPQGGTVSQPALPIKFSTYQPEYKKIGMPAGTHTTEVMQELGFTADQIEDFTKTGLFS
jgi:crotonobetainyl-CoA:carnitine CoA-transferase CaiB-like acyl-CoA transferase